MFYGEIATVRFLFQKIHRLSGDLIYFPFKRLQLGRTGRFRKKYASITLPSRRSSTFIRRKNELRRKHGLDVNSWPPSVSRFSIPLINNAPRLLESLWLERAHFKLYADSAFAFFVFTKPWIYKVILSTLISAGISNDTPLKDEPFRGTDTWHAFLRIISYRDLL